jgi:hypothetical protein
MCRNMRSIAYCTVIVVYCVSHVHCFLHGEPEQSDDPHRSKSAQEMLNRLWSAARERADLVRTNRAQAQGRGDTYSLTNADMFGSMIDYMKDKVTTPPLLSTEQNFLLLHQNILALAREIRALHKITDALLEHDTAERAQSAGDVPVRSALRTVLAGQLVPVQGPRYTIIRA